MSFKPSDLRDLRDLRVLIVEDEHYSDLRDLRDLRVLIVEDEYYLAADLAEALRDRGAQVPIAEGSSSAAPVTMLPPSRRKRPLPRSAACSP